MGGYDAVGRKRRGRRCYTRRSWEQGRSPWEEQQGAASASREREREPMREKTEREEARTATWPRLNDARDSRHASWQGHGQEQRERKIRAKAVRSNNSSSRWDERLRKCHVEQQPEREAG